MPTSKRHFAPGQLQFLTSSTYRRAALFESDRFRCSFVEALRQLRIEMGCPFGVGSEKKRLEKLNYIHGNPVKCGLVASPEQRPWSSFPVGRRVALCASLRRVSARILIPVQG
jgi:hypothetical protein